MSDQVFPICTRPAPRCIGREALLAQLTGSLMKAIPDHIQVVGPRFAGKTVLLSELVRRLQAADKHYAAAIHWDLAHLQVDDDAHFMGLLGTELARALANSHQAYSEHLTSIGKCSGSDIAEVLDALKGESSKVLVVLDGFDRVVANGKLTRNLWDQLRELAIKPSLRLVTASRKRLSELIRDPNAETSPFWNIFSPPVRVGCFDELDVSAVLAAVPGLKLNDGARAELIESTNGSPVSLLEVLNSLHAAHGATEVKMTDVRAALDTTFPKVRDRVEIQWDDCAKTAKELFLRVREQGTVSRGDVSPVDSESLLGRGFVSQSGGSLRHPNKFLGMLLDQAPSEGSSLARLFATEEAYNRNLRSVFEYRIGSIEGLDATIERYLRRGLADLPEHPDMFLTHIRGFVDKAFDLIWRAEIPDRRIPSGWISVWKRNGERRIDEFETTFPQGVHAVRLLSLMTGTDRSQACAKHVTKRLYVLVNAVHGFGNFGQHQNGAPVDVGSAYAALLLGIEMAAALTNELRDA